MNSIALIVIFVVTKGSASCLERERKWSCFNTHVQYPTEATRGVTELELFNCSLWSDDESLCLMFRDLLRRCGSRRKMRCVVVSLGRIEVEPSSSTSQSVVRGEVTGTSTLGGSRGPGKSIPKGTNWGIVGAAIGACVACVILIGGLLILCRNKCDRGKKGLKRSLKKGGATSDEIDELFEYTTCRMRKVQ